MAEKGDEDAESSSWWSSFYDSAKRKLAETNEFMLRDMKEFTDTVKTDASKLVAATASTMKDQLNIKVDLQEASHATKVVTNTLTDFLGNVVHQVTPQNPDSDENDDSTAYVGTFSGIRVVSPSEARLFTLQTDPGTYCNEPDNLQDLELWLESFKLDDKRDEISLLMLDCKEVRTLYNKLVPDAVSHHNFWTRYYFKRQQLEKAEKRRAELVQRAEKKQPELSWDDEEDVDTVPTPELPQVKEDTHDTTPQDVASKVDETSSQSAIDSNTNKVPNAPEEPATALPKQEDKDNVPYHVKSPPDVGVEPVLATENTDCTKALNDDVQSDAKSSSSEFENISVEQSSQSSDSRDGSNAECVKKEESVSKVDMTEKKDAQTPVPAKESSSGGSSDWEKEFDLDMTEDEIKEALLEGDENIDEVDIDGWEDWE